MATFVEVSWEIALNSAWIIYRYREVSMPPDKHVDSVGNPILDFFAMIFGFGLARNWSVWASVAVVIGLEVPPAWTIRDGPFRNVLMLVWPLDWVRASQVGG